jgi:hypothetical protein
VQRAATVLSVMCALLVTSGGVRAQPLDNPDLSDVQTAVFFDYGKSHFSVVFATMSGYNGLVAERFHGTRSVYTPDGAVGVGVFSLYEPDEIKRKGAGNWQIEQSDNVLMAFWISTALGRTFSHGLPFPGSITGLYDYFGSPLTYPVSTFYIGSPSAAQLEGCSASISTKDRNRNGLPETANWKAGCSKSALGFLSKQDQKLYKKLVKGLKGKGVVSAYKGVLFPPYFP